MISKEFAENVFEILNTFHEAAKQMQNAYAEGNIEEYATLSFELIQGVESLQEVAKANLPEDDKSRLVDVCMCIIESVKNIFRLADNGSTEVAWKLENELEDFVESAEIQFLYHQMVKNGFVSFEEYRQFLADSHKFRLLREPENKRIYSNDLTLSVTGYNKLNYTKKCVESVLRNIPLGVRCELILINHGSSDGTQEYFESILGAHVINIAINGALPTSRTAIADAPNYIGISNDVIIGKNAIANIYRALVENEDYGYIVPSTPNVSNLQTIEATYNNLIELEGFCDKNNKYDLKRHEQRVRLCNPLTGIRVSVHLQKLYDMFEDFTLDCYDQSFPDDKNSLWMRRHRYKNILMKDAYCHHFGSVTIKEDKTVSTNSNEFYLNGRRKFIEKYGVDPWGIGQCYDYRLFNALTITRKDACSILGINCGLGSNSLKIKESLREQGAEGTILINLEQNSNYISDLKGVSDEAYLFNQLTDIKNLLSTKSFYYLIIDGEVKGYPDKAEVVKILNESGITFQTIILKNSNGDWEISEGISNN